MAQLGRGTNIGPFIIEKEISRGGMATVYQARPAMELDGFPSHVAIKVAKEGYEDFLRDEEEHLRHLQHPNIIRPVPIPTKGGESDRKHYIRCAELGESSVWYLVLEHLEGGSLAELLQVRRKLPTDVAVEIATQVAMALDHLHRVRGVAHLDIRPDNILFRQDPLSQSWRPEVVLCDFGIAWHNKQAPTDSYGDLPYIAPERRRGDCVTDACDVYSLGVVLYEMLTGVRPYPVDEAKAADTAISSEAASLDPLRKQRSVPSGLESVIHRAIARRSDDRYRTISAFLEDLRPVQLELTAKSGRKKIASKQVFRWGIGILLMFVLISVSFLAGLRAWQILRPDGSIVPPLAAVTEASRVDVAFSPVAALDDPTPSPTQMPSPAPPTHTSTPRPTLAPKSSLPTVSRPTSTLQSTRTPRPSTPTVPQSPTPRPTVVTNTPRPTVKPTKAKPKPTATPKPLPPPSLQNPPDQHSVDTQVTFSWAWTGSLSQAQYFEVRIRRYPDTMTEYRGVGLPTKEHSVAVDLKRLVEDTANWNNWLGGQRVQHGDELWWTVALVQWNGNASTRSTLLVESAPRSLRFVGHPGETPVVCACSEELCGNCTCREPCCIKCCKKCQ